jgi:hypothetical protein
LLRARSGREQYRGNAHAKQCTPYNAARRAEFKPVLRVKMYRPPVRREGDDVHLDED